MRLQRTWSSRLVVRGLSSAIGSKAEVHRPGVFVVDKVTQVSTASNKALGTQGQLVQQEHHSAPVVMAEFAKKCPAVSFTEDQSVADFILQTQPEGSTLADPKGNILYVSPAKNLGNMVKDVCKFISGQ